MAIARFNLKNTSDKEKETLIYLVFRFNEKRLKITTGETVLPKHWNFAEQKVREIKSYLKHTYVNDRLRELKNAIEIAYRELQKRGIDPSIKELKKEYVMQLSGKIPQKSPEFWEEYEQFIQNEKGRVVNDVIKDYNALKKHLRAFEKHYHDEITFSSFNFSFYQKFIQYLTYEAEKPNGEKGLLTNTIGKHIKNLKIFLNNCFKREIIDRFDLSDFKTLSEDVDKIYLTEVEIDKIYKLDLSQNPDLEKYRDLFVLGCYIGLRISDLSRIVTAHITNDEIRIKQKKTDRYTIIPLHPIAKEIVTKYNQSIPKGINSENFNKNIKLIGKLAGITEKIVITRKQGIKKSDIVFEKYELISSHTCRRSFCTNQYLRLIPSYLIMKISGHKTEKSFLRYIRIDEELAAKKIKEYW
jgi:integrase